MSIKELLNDDFGKVKNVSCDTIKIHGNMNNDLDGINVKYFKENSYSENNCNIHDDSWKHIPFYLTWYLLINVV